MTAQLLLGVDVDPVDLLAEHKATIRRAIMRDAVDHSGTISSNRVRHALDGRGIPPRLVGQVYRAMVREGLIAKAGHETSDDHKGGNGGRLIPMYLVTAVGAA